MSDSIRYLVIQGGCLEHFALCTLSTSSYGDLCWSNLGLALRSVRTVSLCPGDAGLDALPHLESCESLTLAIFGGSFRRIGSIPSCLPNLRTVVVDATIRATDGESFQQAFLDMIKSSNSITKAGLKGTFKNSSFQDRVDSFCIVNKVLGTNLLGFSPSELWTRILSKMCDDSARTDFLYRLLREKPELANCAEI